ncbi:MAG: hypothetical protein L0Z70_03660 [Chloroflexi bacterium]|nr:hypothetical protein [Chloroflexota bacterium]
MQPTLSHKNPPVSRLGFHYFPDTLHYSEKDLNAWLPELNAMGVGWLVLPAPHDRAIPEAFIRGLLHAGIQPVLHFALPVDGSIRQDDFELLFHVYASWGARYVALFDRPNLRSSWPSAGWPQGQLVERFLDIFIPLANKALEKGLRPVFPPLEPGGDYWDTVFLRAALQGLIGRGQVNLLHALSLGAYAWADGHPLDWGAGGPESWPGARPYITPPGQQDQRGFYIFNWYLSLARAVLGRELPILLLGAGRRVQSQPADDDFRLEHARTHLEIARRMRRVTPVVAQEADRPPVPASVLCANFWVLSASERSAHRADAWFPAQQEALPAAAALKQLHIQDLPAPLPDVFPITGDAVAAGSPAGQNGHPISHYLLLPLQEWGLPDWQLDSIRPFITKHRPTVGFSTAEAALAARVTVVGGAQAFSENALDYLRRNGCQVVCINGDGTEIATYLASV